MNFEITDGVFGVRLLHHEGMCETTACLHCSACGLGPQTYLTYRYPSDGVNVDGINSVGYRSNGLCPRCAA